MSPCQSFSKVVMTATRDKDYRLVIRDRSSGVTIAAVHGGTIDPPTSELATSIADQTYNLYIFHSLRADGENLRVPTKSFDEIRLRALMRRSHCALSLEGIAGEQAMVHIGGRNRRLKRILSESLGAEGFCVQGPAGPGAAHDPRRFFNTPEEGGVQIELTAGLCQAMLDCPLYSAAREDPSHWTDRYAAFVRAVRRAIEQYRAKVADDLELTMERFEEATDAFPKSMRGGHHHHG